MKPKRHHGNCFSYLFLSLILMICVAVPIAFRSCAGDPPESIKAAGTPEVTVLLDAGHGGEDGGATAKDGTAEKNLNLEIAKRIGTILSANGIRVAYTRTEDILLYDRSVDYHGRKKILDLAARLEAARKTENAIFVSIHMNSFPEEKYSGLQVFHSPNNPLSEVLADAVQENVRTVLSPENNRKPKAATSSIYLLHRLECPAILIECGFLSNPAEAILLGDAHYRQKLSLVIADAIAGVIEKSS